MKRKPSTLRASGYDHRNVGQPWKAVRFGDIEDGSQRSHWDVAHLGRASQGRFGCDPFSIGIDPTTASQFRLLAMEANA